MELLNSGTLSTTLGPYSFRPAEPDDAAVALAFFARVRGESPYLLLGSDEGSRDVDAQRRQFVAMRAERKHVVFFAFYLDHPVGFIGLSRGGFIKNQHVATMAVAVQALHQRRGIAACLIRVATTWAQAEGIKRLELTAATENEGAIRLYRDHGFIAEGTKHMSFRIGERLVDELLMARILKD